MIKDQAEYDKMSKSCNPYGDGYACERIADILEGKEYSPWVGCQVFEGNITHDDTSNPC